MRPSMMTHMKYLVFPLIALIMIHLGLVHYKNKERFKLLSERNRQFDNQIQRLESRKIMALKKFKFYISIYNDLKPWLDTGFEDPEKGLVKFLDYLSPSLLQKVNATVSIQNTNVSQRQPIPLQKSSFMIGFDFLYTQEIEHFLKMLFLQEQYPIKIKAAKIQRQSKKRTKGEVTFELLIPVNLKQLGFEDFNNL